MTLDEPVICSACGHVGMPLKKTRGSGWMEKMLWIVLLFPGIFYTLWRRAGRQRVCRKCGAPDLVSVDTLLGQKLLEKHLKTKTPS